MINVFSPNHSTDRLSETYFVNFYSRIVGKRVNKTIKVRYNGLIQVKEEGWRGFSEGWQGCSEDQPC